MLSSCLPCSNTDTEPPIRFRAATPAERAASDAVLVDQMADALVDACSNLSDPLAVVNTLRHHGFTTSKIARLMDQATAIATARLANDAAA